MTQLLTKEKEDEQGVSRRVDTSLSDRELEMDLYAIPNKGLAPNGGSMTMTQKMKKRESQNDGGAQKTR